MDNTISFFVCKQLGPMVDMEIYNTPRRIVIVVTDVVAIKFIAMEEEIV